MSIDSFMIMYTFTFFLDTNFYVKLFHLNFCAIFLFFYETAGVLPEKKR